MREEEIATAPYEVLQRVDESRYKLLAIIDQTWEEIGLVERELETVRRTEEVLAASGALNAIQQRDRLRLERLTLEAQQVFQRAYLTGLRQLVDGGG